MEKKSCLRKGCNKTYLETENSETACHFHPGAPIFHDTRKGWQCCTKRVEDFDEFLKIEGCTLGRHSSDNKEEANDSSSTSRSNSHGVPVETGFPNHIDKALMEEECQQQVRGLTLAEGLSSSADYSSDQKKGSMKNLSNPLLLSETTKVGSFLPCETIDDKAINVMKEPQEEEIWCEENLHDDIDVDIPIGTVCKRKACGASYMGSEESRTTVCTFHPGNPIFHEGSKGWSCCRRRVLEFEEFLEIKGCKTGKHRFLEKPFEVNCWCYG
jgi:hypothetical protein